MAKYLTQEEKNPINNYIWQLCGALGRYFKDREFQEVPVEERVDGLIEILKFGYGDTQRFVEIFPQYLIEAGQEPHDGLVLHMSWLLSCQVITNPQQQKVFRKRLEEEVLTK